VFFRAPELEGLLRLHSLALLLQGLQSPALALLLRTLDLRQRVRLDLVRRGIEAVATIGLALWLHNAWAVIGGQLIGFALNSALSYRVAPFRPRLSLDRELLRPFLQYAKHLNLTTILIFGVTSGGEYVIGRMLGTAALGLYQIALALPTLIGTRLPLMMNRVSFPAYMLLERDRRATVRAFGLQFGVMGLLLLPLSAVLALSAPDVVGLLAGEQWREAAEPLRVLALFTLCCGLSVVMGALHYGLNHPEFQTRIWMVQFLIYAVLLVPLGLAAFSIYCRVTLGDPLAFSHAQDEWGRRFAPPWVGPTEAVQAISAQPILAQSAVHNLLDLVVVLATVGLLGLCVIGPWRLPGDQLFLMIYAAATLLVVLTGPVGGLFPMMGAPRYALELIPIFLLLARLGASRQFERLYLLPAVGLQVVLLLTFLNNVWVA